MEVNRGRLEVRSLQLCPGNFGVEEFANVQQVGKLVRSRYHKCKRKEEYEEVYVITNLRVQEAGAKEVLAWLRGHWQIENNLHRVRDVQMNEDASRIRKGHAPQLLAALSNAVVGLWKRAGYASPKAAAETLRADPRQALKLITCET